MNYRHAYHAGNHADVLKHAVLLALCDALRAKPAAAFALDTHAGRGLYRLDDAAATATGEALAGIERLTRTQSPLLRRYLRTVDDCRRAHGDRAYPGSPWLLAHALREQDRITCCELHPQEADYLRRTCDGDQRITVRAQDGYAAMKALLPPRDGQTRLGRGLVLIDPPYETQLDEFDTALAALSDALQRWPQGMYALWYPIKQRRVLQRFHRRAAALPCKGSLVCELLVRPDDSPLRMNGSGMLLLNPPWRIEQALAPMLAELQHMLGEHGRGSHRLDFLRKPD